jgi:excisionase family DNA binding protein
MSDVVEKLLTAEEVAEVLGISKLTVYQMARAGRIKRVELGLTGRAIRFRPSDVRAFVDAATTDSPTVFPHRRRRRVS